MFLARELSLVYSVEINSSANGKKRSKSAVSKFFFEILFHLPSLPSSWKLWCFFLWKCDSWKLMKDGFTNNNWQVVPSLNNFNQFFFLVRSFLTQFQKMFFFSSPLFAALSVGLALPLNFFANYASFLSQFLDAIFFFATILQRNDDDDICGCFFLPSLPSMILNKKERTELKKWGSGRC